MSLTAGLLGLAVLLVGGLWLAANSERGQDFLAAQIETLTSVPGERQVEIEGLRGRLPQSLRLGAVRVYDAEGLWLELESARLDWLPSALLSRSVHIRDLSADRIAVHRAPRPGETQEPSPPGEPSVERFRLPELPVTLRLDHLSVASLELGEELAGGESARLSVEGRAAAPQAEAIETELAVRRLDGPGTALTLTASLQPDTRVLSLDLLAQDPEDGLIANLANLPGEPDVDLSLIGEGPLEDWHGELRGRLGDLASIETAIGLSLPADRTQPLAVTLEGRAEAPGFLDEMTRPLAGDGIAFEIAANQLDEIVTVERLSLSNNAIELAGQAVLDTGANAVDASISGQLLDDEAVVHLTGPARIAGLSFSLDAEGPLPLPQASAQIRLSELEAPESRVSDLVLDAEVLPRGRDARQADVSARLRAAALHLDPPQAAGLTGAPLALDLDGHLDLDASRFEEMAFALDYAMLGITAQGALGWQPLAVDTRIAMTASDLAALNAAAPGLDLTGRLGLDADISVVQQDEGLEIAASTALAGEEIALGQPLGDAVVGPNPRLSADLLLRPDGTIRLSDARLEAQALHAEADFDLSPATEEVDGQLLVTLDDLQRFFQQAGTPLAGSGSLHAEISGSLEAARIAADLDMSGLRVQTFDLGQVEGRLRAEGPVEAPAGEFRLSSGSPYGRVQAQTGFAISPEEARLQRLSLGLPGVSLTSPELIVALGEGGPLAQGDLRLQAPDLSRVQALSALGEMEAAGALHARLRLLPQGGRQNASLGAQLADLVFRPSAEAEPITLSLVELTAELNDLLNAPRFEALLEAQNLVAGPAEVPGINLAAAGTPEAVDLDLRTGATLPEVALSLESRAQLRPQPGGLAATLAALDMEVNGQSLRLMQPAEIAQQGQAISVQDFLLAVEDGEVALDLAMDAQQVDAALSIARLPLSIVNAFVEQPSMAGRMDLDVSLAGPAQAPTGSLRLSLDDVVSDAVEELPPLDALVEGQLGGGRFALDGRVENLTRDAFVLSADVPLALSLQPFAVEMDEQAAIAAALDWEGELGPLMSFVPATAHDLQGRGEIDLRAEGTLGDPTMSGAVQIIDATYENYDSGTLLRGLNLRVEGEGNRLTLSHLEGTDGGRGRLSGSGEILVDPLAGMPMDFRFNVADAVLVRRDDVTARVDADLSIAGDLQDLAVTGRIVTREVEARLPDQFPPNVVDLGAVEAGTEPDETARDEDEEEAPPSVVRLDITVELPNRVFARGAGLDSEWAGGLHITGTAAQPIINGEIRQVRGQLDFLGRTFTFSEAVIQFDGGRDPDPILDIVADYSTRDAEVQVLVTGRASDPEIALTSVPELPQDEILSRVMFGRSAGQLGALEAAQLALAIQQLRSGGPGVMDQLRNTLGVDVLRVSGGDGEDEGPTVTAGRYLTDRIFLGVEQGTQEGSSAVTVEVELTDNIFLESDVGAGGRSNVGIQFRWDY